MKNFSKYGVSAAVAAVAAASVTATEISSQDLGDAAIIPYYNVNSNYNTGFNITNTSDATQVVKFRFRRGTDSADALDFNIIMSPYDVWNASIALNGDDIRLTTNDNSCTAPRAVQENGGVSVPDSGINFRENAEEGYIEIIGMGQLLDESLPMGVNAKHQADGEPLDCVTVEQNFFRLDGDAGSDTAAGDITGTDLSTFDGNLTGLVAAVGTAGLARTINGVHNSSATSNGAGTGVAVNAFVDTPNVLKVQYFVRNRITGLEVGDNAVHLTDFASKPMITNQQLLGFQNGDLKFDPYNFELPNLNQGAYFNNNGRFAAHSGVDMGSIVAAEDASGATVDPINGYLYQGVRNALGATAIINSWGARDLENATVNSDWVVTMPGQYAMTDVVCAAYALFDGTSKSCNAAWDTDKNDLPVVLDIEYWDREEDQITLAGGGLSVSPGGTGSADTELPNEVNVIVWAQEAEADGVLGSQDDLKFVFDVSDSGFDAGWAKLSVEASSGGSEVFLIGAGTTTLGSGDDVVPATAAEGATDSATTYGSYASVSGNVPIIGAAFWERNFGNNAAANYGRTVEHSYENAN